MILHQKKVSKDEQIVQNMVQQNRKQLLNRVCNQYFPYRVLRGTLISSGKKRIAERLISRLFYHIRITYNVHPLIFLNLFFEKMRPKVGLFSKKIAGINYKIPVPITYKKSVSVMLHWWLASAKKNSKGRDFYTSFVSELDDAYRNPLSSIAKRRDESHRLAHLNRPFLKYLRIKLCVHLFNTCVIRVAVITLAAQLCVIVQDQLFQGLEFLLVLLAILRKSCLNVNV
jgi:ribosomal protein S7